MEAQREQSWRIRITSKAKNFNFRFRFAAATHASTRTLSFFRFSILLNLPPFVFKFNSLPKKHGRASFKFIRTKIMKIFPKFRPRLHKNRTSINANIAKNMIASNLSYAKVPNQIGFWVKGFLCVVQSIINSMRFFVASLLFKNLKFMNLTQFLLMGAATVVCYMIFCFDYNHNLLKYITRFAWNKMGFIVDNFASFI